MSKKPFFFRYSTKGPVNVINIIIGIFLLLLITFIYVYNELLSEFTQYSLFILIIILWFVMKKMSKNFNNDTGEDLQKNEGSKICKKCKREVILSDSEIQARKFICPDCKTENIF